MTILDLLKALDPHNNTSVSARYKNKMFLGDTIFICTNIPITEWYMGEELVLRNALYRRISRIFQFGELQPNGTVQYFINKIISSDSVKPDNHAPMQLQLVEKVKTFNLNKYISFNSDENRVNEFIGNLDDL